MDTALTAARTGALARHRWAICAGVLAGLAGAGGTLLVTQPRYVSSTSVLVNPVGTTAVNLATEAQLVRSSETAAAAATLADEPTLTAATMLARVSVEPLAQTSVLVIRFEAGTPPAAQVGARAFAEAYLANRFGAARESIDDQTASLTAQIDAVSAELAGVNERIARRPRPAELANLRGTATTLTAQIMSLSTRRDELATTPLDPGRVIREADLPLDPVRPDGWPRLAGGAGLGALLGAAAAMGRERLSSRVRDGADVARRCAIPVLVELPDGAELASVPAPRDRLGQAFSRLRNEVVAALGAGERLILVTAAGEGVASTAVAADLAVALARADNDVVLVGANVPEMAAVALSSLFDVADIPGLTDVLTGRVSLSRALQRAPRLPRLRVITPGGTASAGGLLQCEAARRTLRTLRGYATYVVVEAPAASGGADAQSLAGVADAAIVVAQTGRTRYSELIDATAQLRLIGGRVLGVVLLPRVTTSPGLQVTPHAAAAATAPIASDVWLAGRPSLEAPTIALPQTPVR